jgi:hypothetical protein
LPQPIHPRSSDLLHHAFRRRVFAARSIHQGHRVVVQIGECIPLQLFGPSGLDGRIGDLAQRSKFWGKRTTGGFPRLEEALVTGDNETPLAGLDVDQLIPDLPGHADFLPIMFGDTHGPVSAPHREKQKDEQHRNDKPEHRCRGQQSTSDPNSHPRFTTTCAARTGRAGIPRMVQYTLVCRLTNA